MSTTVRKLRINRSGYVAGTNHYYGVGMPVYEAEHPDGRTLTFRAHDRAAACRIVEHNWPDARIANRPREN